MAKTAPLRDPPDMLLGISCRPVLGLRGVLRRATYIPPVAPRMSHHNVDQRPMRYEPDKGATLGRLEQLRSTWPDVN